MVICWYVHFNCRPSCKQGCYVKHYDVVSGEEELSYGYGGTAKASTECKFRDYGEKFGAGDVITAYLVREILVKSKVM